MKRISLLITGVVVTLVSVFSQATFDHLYVVGNACSAGWTNSNPLAMTQTEAGVFTWTGALQDYTGDNGNRRFKFLTQIGSWNSITVGDPASGHKVITSGVEEDLRVHDGGNDNAFQVPVTAEYEVIVNLNTMKMTCTQTSSVDPDAIDLEHLYLVGGAVPIGWSIGTAMTKLSSGEFVWACLITPRADGSDPAKFKFQNRLDTWNYRICPAEDVEFAADTEYDLIYNGADKKFIVTEATAGMYEIHVNLNTLKVWFVKVPDLTQLYMVGDATPAGWNNNNPETMTWVSEGVFTWSGGLTMGQFKFQNATGNWSKSINPVADVELQIDTEYELRYRPVEATPNDKKFIVTVPGDYVVNVNLNTLKMVCHLISANDTASVIRILGGNISECGRTSKLSIETTPANAWIPPIVWTIDNDNVAFIGVNGKLYPKSNGTVTVTATATLDDGTILSDSKELTINGQTIDDYSLAIMGSSVPSGAGADAGIGYAQLWEQYLENNAATTWATTNISIGGNNTTDVSNRWDNDFLPTCSRYLYYGLSLGNEGIHEKGQTAFDSWRDNMLALIERARDAGKIPVVGNNYPRGDFNATDYAFVKQLNLLIHEWDVPSVNLLGAIDNGAGQWADGYIADNSHPNTAGHAEMFYAIVPSSLDALAIGKPQPQRIANTSLTLTKTEMIQRIAFVPENVLHSFTLTFGFKTTDTGTIASFTTENGDSTFLKINTAGALVYQDASASSVIVNDGQWHTVSLTHYYAWGRTLLYLDGATVNTGIISEQNAPVKFYLNHWDNAPQTVDYRELYFHRAGMSPEEIQSLHEGKMLKSSLEIYAPLDATATDILHNDAQSLNTLRLETDRTYTAMPVITNTTFPAQGCLYSLTGQKIGALETLHASSLPKGIYILKVQQDDRVFSQKIGIK
ncbi:MAG: SusF/SusE family outer membrane protein [Candidatus Symbiothrix sp.]|jgi:hypothetical protein|nr:SusF/SusE family outer membrane protein [Candidatus Symbiothrix sp.]